MATAGAKPTDCELVRVGILKLEDANYNFPEYTGVVVLPADMLIVIDSNAFTLRLHSCHDGLLLATSDKLQAQPYDVCVLDRRGNEVAVTLRNGQIEILSVESQLVAIRRVRTLDVTGEFKYCHGVGSLRLGKDLVVSGGKEEKDAQWDWICWGLVSHPKGDIGTVHKICKCGGAGYGSTSYLATSTDDSMIYISCWTGPYYPENNGVYACDIMTGSLKFSYHNRDLTNPKGISVDRRGFIYVCNWDPTCIHQLTEGMEPVAIHRKGMPRDPMAMDWEKRQEELYVTRMRSREVWRLCPQWNKQQTFSLVTTRTPQPQLAQKASAQQLYHILQHSNLLQYFEAFIAQGGDDVQQLCDAEEEEFEEIMELVGMKSRPLHVRRLKKALQEWFPNPGPLQDPAVQIDESQTVVASLGMDRPSSPMISKENEDPLEISNEGNRAKSDEQLLEHFEDESPQVHLQNIEPSAQGVPIEILNMDDRSIQLFEEALRAGKENVYNIRVMVVGHFGVGKTTLIKRLLGEEVDISKRLSTEGIDVYVNCSDVSLSTGEWTRRIKDSEQDYQLQRLVKVLNEQQLIRNKVTNEEQVVILSQGERTDSNANVTNKEQVVNPLRGERTLNSHEGVQETVEDMEVEVLNTRSPQKHLVQTFSSSNSQEEQSPSALVQKKLTQSETKTMAMLKLLQENAHKLKLNTDINAPLTVWDFAGQYAFYTTHQTFLSRRAIYLLVSDVSEQVTDLVADECYFDCEGIMKCKVHELTEVWLNSIHSCAPSPESCIPPVILVGTHVDQISQRYRRDICRKYFREIRHYLNDKPTKFHLVDEDFAIDNTVVDSHLEDLRMKILEVASTQPYWGEEIPARWLLLEQELMRHKASGLKVISYRDVQNINKEGTVRIESSEELDLFLRFLHETGKIIYFSIEVLRENIVLDPTWLIDALKSLINAQPIPPVNPADKGSQSDSPTDSNHYIFYTHWWSDFKEMGILTSELVDAIWTREKYPELYCHKDHILRIMEQLNIIAKPRSFNIFGEKMENYFLVPCMLRQKSPREVISPEQDPLILSTPVLCCYFKGKFLPPPVFHRLLAACVARWPVAKKKETSENLIFCGCCVFDLDLFHRLTLHCKNHVVFARITKMLIYDVKPPDAKLCTRVRRFITLNLSKITSYLGQNLQYELRIYNPPFQGVTEDGFFFSSTFEVWFADEGHDPDAPITPEHMNHARLCVAVVTVCVNALREILLINVPVPYKDIYQAILANRASLTRRQGRPLLNSDQCQTVFPDPQGHRTGTVDQFDLSLLYILIRNISTVPAPVTGWGSDPQDQPRDTSLGASVERIRSYRNHISGHSHDGKISQQDFDDYWNKFEAVLHDIETVIGKSVYQIELEKQKRQVISVYEAC